MTTQHKEFFDIARTLWGAVTIRDIMEQGDRAIQASGLNLWCINEGLATGDESAPTGWIDDIERSIEAEREKVRILRDALVSSNTRIADVLNFGSSAMNPDQWKEEWEANCKALASTEGTKA